MKNVAKSAPVVMKNANVEVEETGKKQKRPSFDKATARTTDGKPVTLDGEGRLLAPVANWTPDFQPLGRSDFADRTTFFNHRALTCDMQIARLQARRADFLEQASEASGGGDPIKKKQRKLEKLQKELLALQKELAAQGLS